VYTLPEGLDFNTLDKIIKDTMSAIEVSKDNIFDLAETAKNDQRRMYGELERANEELKQLIETVNRLELMYKKARVNLMEVSRDFTKYSEDDIKKTYQYAHELQVQLAVEKERENSLRLKRDELARSIVRVNDMVKKADDLVSKVDIAQTFLNGNLTEFSQQMEGMHQKQLIGGRIILAQEEERKRVAREIHDGPAQSMANVVLRAEFCEKLLASNRGEVAGELHQLKQIVKDSLQEVRRIIFNLRPMTLDDLGLVPTLKRFLEEIKDREGYEVKLEVFGEERRLKNTYEVALFRLVQEGLNNSRKHSQATQILIEITFSATNVHVKIVDNGKGFDLQKVLNEVSGKESYGLLSMKERIELLNGKLVIETAPGQGTRITTDIPMDQAIYN
jgi:two-component system, NarL family, sensor histidine kinase DegS